MFHLTMTLNIKNDKEFTRTRAGNVPRRPPNYNNQLAEIKTDISKLKDLVSETNKQVADIITKQFIQSPATAAEMLKRAPSIKPPNQPMPKIIPLRPFVSKIYEGFSTTSDDTKRLLVQKLNPIKIGIQVTKIIRVGICLEPKSPKTT